jgi:hypothetical protein
VHGSPQGVTCAVAGLHQLPRARRHPFFGPAGGAQPLNTAQPSPDGQWVAVGRDDTRVVLLPAAPG